MKHQQRCMSTRQDFLSLFSRQFGLLLLSKVVQGGRSLPCHSLFDLVHFASTHRRQAVKREGRSNTESDSLIHGLLVDVSRDWTIYHAFIPNHHQNKH
jgi:hypothetical protein